jgi:hypothetical protein
MDQGGGQWVTIAKRIRLAVGRRLLEATPAAALQQTQTSLCALLAAMYVGGPLRGSQGLVAQRLIAPVYDAESGA